MRERIDPREPFDQNQPTSEDWVDYETWLDELEARDAAKAKLCRRAPIFWDGTKLCSQLFLSHNPYYRYKK